MKFHVARDEGRLVVHTIAAEAKSVDPNYNTVDIPTDKPGLMAWYQKQLDEQAASSPPADESQEPAAEAPESASAAASGDITAAAILALPSNELSILIEEIFDSLPIMTQLHYGSRAIEEARDQIGGHAINPSKARPPKG